MNPLLHILTNCSFFMVPKLTKTNWRLVLRRHSQHSEHSRRKNFSQHVAKLISSKPYPPLQLSSIVVTLGFMSLTLRVLSNSINNCTFVSIFFQNNNNNNNQEIDEISVKR